MSHKLKPLIFTRWGALGFVLVGLLLLIWSTSKSDSAEPNRIDKIERAVQTQEKQMDAICLKIWPNAPMRDHIRCVGTLRLMRAQVCPDGQNECQIIIRRRNGDTCKNSLCY